MAIKKTHFNDKNVVEKVLEWQKTKDEQLFEEVYDVYKAYLKLVVDRSPWVEDLSSAINETFLNCMIDFKPEKHDKSVNFTAYLLMHVKFTRMKQTAYTIKPHHGAPQVNTSEITKYNRKKKILDIHYGNNWVDLSEVMVEAKGMSPNFREVEFKLMLEDILPKIKEDRLREMVIMLIKGSSQTEIANHFNIKQSRVSVLLHKTLPKRYPLFALALRRWTMPSNKDL